MPPPFPWPLSLQRCRRPPDRARRQLRSASRPGPCHSSELDCCSYDSPAFCPKNTAVSKKLQWCVPRVVHARGSCAPPLAQQVPPDAPPLCFEWCVADRLSRSPVPVHGVLLIAFLAM